MKVIACANICREHKKHQQREDKFIACKYSFLNRAIVVKCDRKEEMLRRTSKSPWDVVAYIFQRKMKVELRNTSKFSSQMKTTTFMTPGQDMNQEILCVYGKMGVSNRDNIMLLWVGLFDRMHDLQGD